ncbi:hypothetical protein [Microseira wollei]|nr:hypothetical protein [Microseira wollei]
MTEKVLYLGFDFRVAIAQRAGGISQKLPSDRIVSLTDIMSERSPIIAIL